MDSSILTVFVGDPFLADEQVKERISRHEKEIPGGVFKQTFRVKETPFKDILGLARTLPFLVQLQIFRILDADLLKEEDIKALDVYLQSPGPRTYLYLQSQNADLKKNSLKTWAEKKKFEVVIFSERDRQGTVARFIKDKLRASGKKIAPDAQRLLEDQAGGHPGLIGSVLDQIVQYSADKPEITSEIVALFEEKMTAINIYELVDAVCFGKTARALFLFNSYLEENDADLISFLGLLHWQLRRFWLAASLLEQGVSENAVLFRCGVRDYQAKIFMRQARQLSRASLEKAIEGLFQTDWALKTGRFADERIAVESWLMAAAGS